VVLTEYRSSMQLAGNSHRAPQAWAHSSPNSSFNAGASSGCLRANSGPEPDRSVHMSGNPLTDAPSRKLEEQVREMEVQLMKSQNEATEVLNIRLTLAFDTELSRSKAPVLFYLCRQRWSWSVLSFSSK